MGIHNKGYSSLLRGLQGTYGSPNNNTYDGSLSNNNNYVYNPKWSTGDENWQQQEQQVDNYQFGQQDRIEEEESS